MSYVMSLFSIFGSCAPYHPVPTFVRMNETPVFDLAPTSPPRAEAPHAFRPVHRPGLSGKRTRHSQKLHNRRAA